MIGLVRNKEGTASSNGLRQPRTKPRLEDDEDYQMAERIRNNLDKLNTECWEKRRHLKKTQQTIEKILSNEQKRSNAMKEKLFLVQRQREAEMLRSKEKLEDSMKRFETRQAQKQADKMNKSVQPSLKDTFITNRERKDLLDELKKYRIYPDTTTDGGIANAANGLMVDDDYNSGEGDYVFNLTAPGTTVNAMNSEAERTMMRLRQGIPKTKQQQLASEKAKVAVNPFYNKAHWEKFMEAERNGEENIRFPGIGIERTPLHEIQRLEIEKKQKQKEMLANLKKYIIKPTAKDKLNFNTIYQRVKDITASSMHTLSLSPSQTLLGHMMEKSVSNARNIWGKDFLRSKSLAKIGGSISGGNYQSFERALNDHSESLAASQKQPAPFFARGSEGSLVHEQGTNTGDSSKNNANTKPQSGSHLIF